MSSLDKIMLAKEPKEVCVAFDGEEYNFKLRDLSWAQKNRIISNCVIYRNNNVTVDVDSYYRMALEAMIVEAPWEKAQTSMILKNINESFGGKLQEFVPSPFGGKEEEEGEIPKN